MNVKREIKLSSNKNKLEINKLSQLSFNSNGELIVTIGNITKVFAPKEETVSASYDKSTEKIIISGKE